MKKTILVAGTAALFAASVAMACDMHTMNSGKKSPTVKQKTSNLKDAQCSATTDTCAGTMTNCGGCAGTTTTNTACCGAGDCGAVD